MRIRHSRLTKDFLQVPNASVRDERLSHMARGILVEILSRPDGWETTADDMWRASAAAQGKTSPGRRQFRAAFAELKEHGYLTAGREPLPNGQHATVLTLTDVPHAGMPVPPAETRIPAGRADVPDGGTSARPGQTKETAGGADVPHAGTSARPAETDESPAHADVPDGGMPGSPAETGNMPDGADVPPAGTPVPPAKTGIRPGRTDVPHAGTSKDEYGKTNTGLNTPSSDAAPRADEDLTEFGNFWLLHPKSRDRDRTLCEWRKAVNGGADPIQITQAAKAYAHERADEPLRFTKHSFTWLRDRRYLDRYQPGPDPSAPPALRDVSRSTTDARVAQGQALAARFRAEEQQQALGPGTPQESA